MGVGFPPGKLRKGFPTARRLAFTVRQSRGRTHWCAVRRSPLACAKHSAVAVPARHTRRVVSPGNTLGVDLPEVRQAAPPNNIPSQGLGNKHKPIVSKHCRLVTVTLS
ncbi:MAG: hypothetical protein F6K28_11615 [Microcoleus sp. SIO2G3]|nr:hypothetical protein [Microcoleus sp. SIO2G3]